MMKTVQQMNTDELTALLRSDNLSGTDTRFTTP